jgi:hypothetical protein
MTEMFLIVLLQVCYFNPNYSYPNDNPKPLTDAQQWALGVSGVLAARNHMDFDSLAGKPINVITIQHQKALLKRWWDVETKDDLLGNLKWLQDKGHSEDFEKYKMVLSLIKMKEHKKLRDEFEEGIKKNHEYKCKCDVVAKYKNVVGEKSLYGWDVARYVCLCRWGYLCGYLTEQEAWDYIMPAARFAQRTFPSWKEFGKNYIIGREFWSPMDEDRSTYEEAYMKLLEMPDSPWKKLPWKLYLGEDEEDKGESTSTQGIAKHFNEGGNNQ